MNIFVNDKPFISDLDVFQQAGCEGALVISKEMELHRDMVAIFLNTTIQNPMISIIEIEKINKSIPTDPPSLTCPCFDQAALESVEAVDGMSSNSSGILEYVYDSQQSGSSFSISSCPDETTDEERDFCIALLVASMDKYRDHFPSFGVDNECPCWPSGPSSLLPQAKEDWERKHWSIYPDYSGVAVHISSTAFYIRNHYSEGLQCVAYQDGADVVNMRISPAAANRCTRDVLRLALPEDAPSFPDGNSNPSAPDCACYDAPALASDHDVHSFYGEWYNYDRRLEVSSSTSTYAVKNDSCSSNLQCYLYWLDAALDKVPQLATPQEAIFPDAGFADRCPCPLDLRSNRWASKGSLRNNENGAYASWSHELTFVSTATFTAATNTKPAKMECAHHYNGRVPESFVKADLTTEEFNRCYSDIAKKIEPDFL